jgi:hypothetical protein
MPNNNATVSAALIGQRALTTLLADFPLLTEIAIDFSSEAVKFDQDIVTHIVAPTIAQDFDPAQGYVPSDQSQADVTVKINKHAHATYAITDTERSKSQIELTERYARVVAHALGLKVVNDLLAVLLAANFPQASSFALNGFNREGVVDIGTKMTKRFLPTVGRFMFLHSDYYNKLCKDQTIFSAYINPAGSNVVTSGVIPNVNGFKIVDSPIIPENGEKLVGFAGLREGLIIAARVPDVPPNTGDTQIEVVTDALTGLSVQVRDRYDGRFGQQVVSYTLMYGFAPGNKPMIERIVKP